MKSLPKLDNCLNCNQPMTTLRKAIKTIGGEATITKNKIQVCANRKCIVGVKLPIPTWIQHKNQLVEKELENFDYEQYL